MLKANSNRAAKFYETSNKRTKDRFGSTTTKTIATWIELETLARENDAALGYSSYYFHYTHVYLLVQDIEQMRE